MIIVRFSILLKIIYIINVECPLLNIGNTQLTDVVEYTDPFTDLLTDLLTDPFTDLLTDPFTDLLTDPFTDLLTDLSGGSKCNWFLNILLISA